MQKELEALGLSEKEARIYLAALEIGRATADQLAKHSKIVRPTAYVQIKQLMAMGLMSTYEEGKKTYFAPESPATLGRLLDRQKESLRTSESLLSSILPMLTQEFEGAGERPVVRFFPGKEGIASVREEILTTKQKKTFIIFSPENLSQMYGEKYLNEYSDRRKALGIHSRGIYTYKEKINSGVLDDLTERRTFPSNILPLTVDIYIYDDKVAILSLEGSLFGLVVQSEQISLSMKCIFDFLWNQAK
jgi:sugar-specific transcriptional regulator TrmB